jgi:ADP-ribose pyrophosphatase YjhB (NUDIX family)
MRTKTRVSAIIISNDQLLLIHRKKEGKEYWVFPGGGVEEGETNEQAIIREMKEETSLDMENARFAFGDPIKWDWGENIFYYGDVKFVEPELGGPEKLKLSEKDWYQPEWINLSKIKDLEIYPEEGKKKLLG